MPGDNVTELLVCSHPDEPGLGSAVPMEVCRCGRSAICPVCGHGWGGIPRECECHAEGAVMKEGAGG